MVETYKNGRYWYWTDLMQVHHFMKDNIEMSKEDWETELLKHIKPNSCEKKCDTKLKLEKIKEIVSIRSCEKCPCEKECIEDRYSNCEQILFNKIAKILGE